MKKNEFYYDLPERLIAQTALQNRDASRLLVIDRKNASFLHKQFCDIVDFLNEGDLLVLNNSRVIPARLFGYKNNGTRSFEIFLLKQLQQNIWETLARPGKKLKQGDAVHFSDDFSCEILETYETGNKKVRFICEKGGFYENLDKIGRMPLPHYIKEELQDNERYQTVYSKEKGSSAAPTAGLHFTNELLERIKAKGVKVQELTLHVGLGTFRPVQAEQIETHLMHSESYFLSQETAAAINETKAKGKRVIAVGTTTARTLEAVQRDFGEIKAAQASTDIFIYPGFKFRCIDGLITNFHLPESTLIMLVSAFAGYELTMKAYKEAVENQYRFFSFGDANFIF